jgi:hypothetical protein
MVEPSSATVPQAVGLTDLTEHSIGSVGIAHAAGGPWSFVTVGAIVEHTSYQSVSETSGAIMPIFGMTLTRRGSGGGYVSGGGGIISSRTKEWCRLVARRGDGRTFSTDGGCELALNQGSRFFVTTAKIAGNDREFLLFSPDSGVSQLKLTADALIEVERFPDKAFLWLVLGFLVFTSHPTKNPALDVYRILGFLFACIPFWYVYRWWTSKRNYRATEAQIEEGIALVVSDFKSRLEGT